VEPMNAKRKYKRMGQVIRREVRNKYVKLKKAKPRKRGNALYGKRDKRNSYKDTTISFDSKWGIKYRTKGVERFCTTATRRKGSAHCSQSGTKGEATGEFFNRTAGRDQQERQ